MRRKQIPDFQYRPSFRVRNRFAKHVQKRGTKQFGGEVQRLAALAADRVGLVEDGGDAMLVLDGWHRHLKLFKLRGVYALLSRPRRASADLAPVVRRLKVPVKVHRIDFVVWSNSNQVRGKYGFFCRSLTNEKALARGCSRPGEDNISRCQRTGIHLALTTLAIRHSLPVHCAQLNVGDA